MTREASATPPAFRDILLTMARSAYREGKAMKAYSLEYTGVGYSDYRSMVEDHDGDWYWREDVEAAEKSVNEYVV